MRLSFFVAAVFFASPAAPAFAQTLPSLPKEMLGVWGYEPEDCDDERADLRLIIEPKRVDFYGAGYELRRIARTHDGGIYATAWRNDEGSIKRYSDTIRLRLTAEGMLSVHAVVKHNYARCKSNRKKQ